MVDDKWSRHAPIIIFCCFMGVIISIIIFGVGYFFGTRQLIIKQSTDETLPATVETIEEEESETIVSEEPIVTKSIVRDEYAETLNDDSVSAVA